MYGQGITDEEPGDFRGGGAEASAFWNSPSLDKTEEGKPGYWPEDPLITAPHLNG
jgi:hypothetical protein